MKLELKWSWSLDLNLERKHEQSLGCEFEVDQRLDVKKDVQAWMWTWTSNGSDDVFYYEEDIKWEEMKT